MNVKRDMLASFVSNIAAMLADSVIFALIAFAGALPAEVVVSIIIVNMAAKGFVAVVGTPLVRLSKLNIDKEKL
jgi:uncharacterized PurR-regulated membrane protein YhhQ (DUF165 family)